jgi:archaellin
VARDNAGVTGLETAIILVAFVVISSVFAFAVLSTGLFTADRSKEAIQAGLGDAQGTLEIKGGIILKASTTGGQTSISGSGTVWTLGMLPVLAGSETITGDGSVLTLGSGYSINYDTGKVTFASSKASATARYTQYRIDSIEINLGNSAGGNPVNLAPGDTLVSYMDDDTASTSISSFGLTRQGVADADNLLEDGEVFTVSINSKSFGLTDRDGFIVQVKPPSGAVLRATRTVPRRIEKAMNLD